MRTIVFSDSQVFRDNFATTGAFLRCASGINKRHTTTSLFRFVRSELHKLIPGHVRYALVNGLPAVLLHILNVKVLKCDELVDVDQLTCLFVGKISSAIRSAFVGVLQSANDFPSFWTTLREPLLLALQAGDVFGVPFHPTLTFNFVSVGECRKCSQTQVNPHNLVGWGKRPWLHNARETGVPITHRIPPDGEGFALSFKRAVKFDLDISDLGQAQTPIIKDLKGR